MIISLSLRSTSTRTFLVFPGVALIEAFVRRRRPTLGFLPLLPWGYLQYRLCGNYRTARGGGGPGLSKPPERIVITGPYAFSRNPMYLGHLIFLVGLALITRSRLMAAALVALVPWYNKHAEGDERRLLTLFPDEYQSYHDSVPRWLGRRSPAASRKDLF